MTDKDYKNISIREFSKAAKVYEDELDEQIRTISKLIEPVLMVVMAMLVGFIVIAVLMPIYAIVSDVQGG